jgi:hypothetical protein
MVSQVAIYQTLATHFGHHTTVCSRLNNAIEIGGYFNENQENKIYAKT